MRTRESGGLNEKRAKENKHREQALITDAALQRVQLFALLKPAA